MADQTTPTSAAKRVLALHLPAKLTAEDPEAIDRVATALADAGLLRQEAPAAHLERDEPERVIPLPAGARVGVEDVRAWLDGKGPA